MHGGGRRHIIEVLIGLQPDAGEGGVPWPEYDPGTVAMARRDRAKAAELTAARAPGHGECRR